MTEAMQVEIVVARPVETYAGVTNTLHNVICHKVVVVIVGGEADVMSLDLSIKKTAS